MPTTLPFGVITSIAVGQKHTLADRPLVLNYKGRDIFVLKKEGTIDADWHAIMALKERLLNCECEDVDEITVATIATALWLARNT